MGEQVMYSASRSGTSDRHRGGTTSRRRRPSLWDVREPPYGVPMPAAGVRTSIGAAAAAYTGATGGAGWATRAPGSHGAVPAGGGAVADGGLPRPAVRPPAPGETGPLAGIDVEALRVLLSGRAGAAGATASPSVAAGSATRHARRLYVGNLPADTVEVQVSSFFNRALVVAGGAETAEPPVVSVYINLEKRFAFIETRTVGEAAAALQLDGLLFRGMSLRMRRPNDFNSVPGAGTGARAPAGFDPSKLGIVSTQVSDGPNKVFIGGIPYHLTEDQIKDILQTYGRLAAFNLIKEPNTGLSKGFAFFEYADPTAVEVACEGLNGMAVEDKVLTVRKASTHVGSFTNGGGVPAGGRTGGGMPAAPETLLPAATRVLELRNVVTDEELADPEEYKELCLEMEEEGRNFGNLLEVLVPRPQSANASAADREMQGVGRVFLRYSEIAECERAFATMSGRKFDQRTVVAAYFAEDRFEKRHF